MLLVSFHNIIFFANTFTDMPSPPFRNMNNTFKSAKAMIQQNKTIARRTFYGVTKKILKDILRGDMQLPALARWYILGKRYGIVTGTVLIQEGYWFSDDLQEMIDRYEMFGERSAYKLSHIIQ